LKGRKKTLKIVYQIVDPPEGIAECLRRDIREEGMRFFVQQELEEGDIVKFEISLPEDTEPIVATGEVVWVNKTDDLDLPYVVKVKLLNIDPVHLGKLNHYICKMIEDTKSDEVYWFGELVRYRNKDEDADSSDNGQEE
jgi:hypothetical protein